MTSTSVYCVVLVLIAFNCTDGRPLSCSSLQDKFGSLSCCSHSKNSTERNCAILIPKKSFGLLRVWSLETVDYANNILKDFNRKNRIKGALETYAFNTASDSNRKVQIEKSRDLDSILKSNFQDCCCHEVKELSTLDKGYSIEKGKIYEVYQELPERGQVVMQGTCLSSSCKESGVQYRCEQTETYVPQYVVDAQYPDFIREIPIRVKKGCICQKNCKNSSEKNKDLFKRLVKHKIGNNKLNYSQSTNTEVPQRSSISNIMKIFGSIVKKFSNSNKNSYHSMSHYTKSESSDEDLINYKQKLDDAMALITKAGKILNVTIPESEPLIEESKNISETTEQIVILNTPSGKVNNLILSFIKENKTESETESIVSSADVDVERYSFPSSHPNKDKYLHGSIMESRNYLSFTSKPSTASENDLTLRSSKVNYSEGQAADYVTRFGSTALTTDKKLDSKSSALKVFDNYILKSSISPTTEPNVLSSAVAINLNDFKARSGHIEDGMATKVKTRYDEIITEGNQASLTTERNNDDSTTENIDYSFTSDDNFSNSASNLSFQSRMADMESLDKNTSTHDHDLLTRNQEKEYTQSETSTEVSGSSIISTSANINFESRNSVVGENNYIEILNTMRSDSKSTKATKGKTEPATTIDAKYSLPLTTPEVNYNVNSIDIDFKDKALYEITTEQGELSPAMSINLNDFEVRAANIADGMSTEFKANYNSLNTEENDLINNYSTTEVIDDAFTLEYNFLNSASNISFQSRMADLESLDNYTSTDDHDSLTGNQEKEYTPSETITELSDSSIISTSENINFESRNAVLGENNYIQILTTMNSHSKSTKATEIKSEPATTIDAKYYLPLNTSGVYNNVNSIIDIDFQDNVLDEITTEQGELSPAMSINLNDFKVRAANIVDGMAIEFKESDDSLTEGNHVSLTTDFNNDYSSPEVIEDSFTLEDNIFLRSAGNLSFQSRMADLESLDNYKNISNHDFLTNKDYTPSETSTELTYSPILSTSEPTDIESRNAVFGENNSIQTLTTMKTDSKSITATIGKNEPVTHIDAKDYVTHAATERYDNYQISTIQNDFQGEPEDNLEWNKSLLENMDSILPTAGGKTFTDPQDATTKGISLASEEDEGYDEIRLADGDGVQNLPIGSKSKSIEDPWLLENSLRNTFYDDFNSTVAEKSNYNLKDFSIANRKKFKSKISIMTSEESLALESIEATERETKKSKLLDETDEFVFNKFPLDKDIAQGNEITLSKNIDKVIKKQNKTQITSKAKPRTLRNELNKEFFCSKSILNQCRLHCNCCISSDGQNANIAQNVLNENKIQSVEKQIPNDIFQTNQKMNYASSNFETYKFLKFLIEKVDDQEKFSSILGKTENLVSSEIDVLSKRISFIESLRPQIIDNIDNALHYERIYKNEFAREIFSGLSRIIFQKIFSQNRGSKNINTLPRTLANMLTKDLQASPLTFFIVENLFHNELLGFKDFYNPKLFEFLVFEIEEIIKSLQPELMSLIRAILNLVESSEMQRVLNPMTWTFIKEYQTDADIQINHTNGDSKKEYLTKDTVGKELESTKSTNFNSAVPAVDLENTDAATNTATFTTTTTSFSTTSPITFTNTFPSISTITTTNQGENLISVEENKIPLSSLRDSITQSTIGRNETTSFYSIGYSGLPVTSSVDTTTSVPTTGQGIHIISSKKKTSMAVSKDVSGYNTTDSFPTSKDSINGERKTTTVFFAHGREESALTTANNYIENSTIEEIADTFSATGPSDPVIEREKETETNVIADDGEVISATTGSITNEVDFTTNWKGENIISNSLTSHDESTTITVVGKEKSDLYISTSSLDESDSVTPERDTTVIASFEDFTSTIQSPSDVNFSNQVPNAGQEDSASTSSLNEETTTSQNEIAILSSNTNTSHSMVAVIEGRIKLVNPPAQFHPINTDLKNILKLLGNKTNV